MRRAAGERSRSTAGGKSRGCFVARRGDGVAPAFVERTGKVEVRVATLRMDVLRRMEQSTRTKRRAWLPAE